MLTIQKSSVPRIAVENTIRRGIDMYEKFNKIPATDEIRKKITRFVIQQANIMNVTAQIKEDEFDDTLLYGRRKT